MLSPLAKTSVQRECLDSSSVSVELILADQCESGGDWRLSRPEDEERERVQRWLTRPGLEKAAPDEKRHERERNRVDFEPGHRQADLITFPMIQPILVVRIVDEVGNNDLRPSELLFGNIRHHSKLCI